MPAPPRHLRKPARNQRLVSRYGTLRRGRFSNTVFHVMREIDAGTAEGARAPAKACGGCARSGFLHRMHVSFDLGSDFDSALKSAATRAGLEGDFNPEVRIADPRHGDFQANGV